uniref:Uncharacterized protein n=1 Tax=Theileria annulata TaxID=5874 RepID=A0A3B0N445_THEAN
MGDWEGESDKKHMFEIYVKQLELEVESKKNVRLSWESGEQKSTTDNVLLYPGLTKHRVDERLVITKRLIPNEKNTTNLKVHEVDKKSDIILLGQKEIDLASLINVTNPLKIKLTNETGNAIKLYIYVTVTPPSASAQSLKSFSPQKLEEDDSYKKQSYEEMSVDLAYDEISDSSLNEHKIYAKISMMSEKLANIEDEILKKTYKLSKLNKENVAEMTKIKNKLEKDIAKKDVQIKVLLSQLDELHTVLSLSHQRELELTEKIRFNPSTQERSALGESALLSEKGGNGNLEGLGMKRAKKDDLNYTTSSSSKSILDDIETNMKDLQRFRSEFETLNDPGQKVARCRELIENLNRLKKTPKRLTTKSSLNNNSFNNHTFTSSSHTSNNFDSNYGNLYGLDDPRTTKGSGTLRHKIPVANTSISRHGMVPFDNKNSSMKVNDLKGNTGRSELKNSNALTVPRLVESSSLRSKIKGGAIFIPKKQEFENSGDGRSISALEKELAETKIKLADSETNNDVYLKQIQSSKK